MNNFGDVTILDMTSDVNVTDARAMLVPEVIEQIAEAVRRSFREEMALEEDRRRDRALDRSSIPLD